MVDLTQYKGTRKVPHIDYVALSRVRKLENLYILNLNEAVIHLDERVTVEMQRLRKQAVLQLSYTPLYKIDHCKIKLAFLLSVFILWFIYYVSDIFCKF